MELCLIIYLQVYNRIAELIDDAGEYDGNILENDLALGTDRIFQMVLTDPLSSVSPGTRREHTTRILRQVEGPS